ncbi:hypothetical protein NC652_026785 [Populus alba x Populus x berolinensis]|nr:hypothetical protein NC652_026785 [Populus alba x Populus x berolinensis]
MGSRHISGEQKANLSNPPSRPSLTRSFSTRQGQAEDCKRLIWSNVPSLIKVLLTATLQLKNGERDMIPRFAAVLLLI